ncbi:hypothetical protein HAX54_017920 [Datura stramonium]|uniref:Uncharacterized protein n=1 Tax=Datura stramonium TaxID=4076 RepID=A0ABS8RJC7_DATST|nr:hypothetical protein [Datura stramonium]
MEEAAPAATSTSEELREKSVTAVQGTINGTVRDQIVTDGTVTDQIATESLDAEPPAAPWTKLFQKNRPQRRRVVPKPVVQEWKSKAPLPVESVVIQLDKGKQKQDPYSTTPELMLHSNTNSDTPLSNKFESISGIAGDTQIPPGDKGGEPHTL